MDDTQAEIQRLEKAIAEAYAKGDGGQAQRLEAELSRVELPLLMARHARAERWKGLAYLAAVAGVVLLLGYGCSRVIGPAKDRDDTLLTAFQSCDRAIRLAAKNPSAAEVPFPPQRKRGPEGWNFYWLHGDGLQLQNGFGAHVEATAICSTDPTGSRVTGLLLDGRHVR